MSRQGRCCCDGLSLMQYRLCPNTQIEMESAIDSSILVVNHTIQRAWREVIGRSWQMWKPMLLALNLFQATTLASSLSVVYKLSTQLPLIQAQKKKKKRRGKLKNKGQQRFIDPSPRIQTDDEVGVSDNRTGGQSSSSCTIRGPRYDINSNTTLLSSTGCCLVLI